MLIEKEFMKEYFSDRLLIVDEVHNLRNEKNDNNAKETLQYLETTDIDKNIKNKNGDNAYILAACNGHLEVLQYLETKNINLSNAKNIYTEIGFGNITLDIAKNKSKSFISKTYLSAGKSIHPHLLALPVVDPNSFPFLAIFFPILSFNSVINGPLPTRVQ